MSLLNTTEIETETYEQLDNEIWPHILEGHYYWVRLAFDVDSDESFEEQWKLQPAKYICDSKWLLLGVECDNDWPVIYVGDEIISK